MQLVIFFIQQILMKQKAISQSDMERKLTIQTNLNGRRLRTSVDLRISQNVLGRVLRRIDLKRVILVERCRTGNWIISTSVFCASAT